MEWNDKVFLVGLLNHRKYDEAVNFLKEHKENIDAQAIDMFIDGFDITEAAKLESVIDMFSSYKDNENVSLRSRMRIVIAQEIYENTRKAELFKKTKKYKYNT